MYKVTNAGTLHADRCAQQMASPDGGCHLILHSQYQRIAAEFLKRNADRFDSVVLVCRREDHEIWQKLGVDGTHIQPEDFSSDAAFSAHSLFILDEVNLADPLQAELGRFLLVNAHSNRTVLFCSTTIPLWASGQAYPVQGLFRCQLIELGLTQSQPMQSFLNSLYGTHMEREISRHSHPIAPHGFFALLPARNLHGRTESYLERPIVDLSVTRQPYLFGTQDRLVLANRFDLDSERGFPVPLSLGSIVNALLADPYVDPYEERSRYE